MKDQFKNIFSLSSTLFPQEKHILQFMNKLDEVLNNFTGFSFLVILKNTEHGWK